MAIGRRIHNISNFCLIFKIMLMLHFKINRTECSYMIKIRLVKCSILLIIINSGRLSFLLYCIWLWVYFFKVSPVFTKCKIVWGGGNLAFCIKMKTGGAGWGAGRSNSPESWAISGLTWDILFDGNKKRVLMLHSKHRALWLWLWLWIFLLNYRALPHIKKKKNEDALYRNKWLRKSIWLPLHGKTLCPYLITLFIFPMKTETEKMANTPSHKQNIKLSF